MTLLSAERAGEILSEARGRRVLVLGDLILDTYVWGSVRRISPEAPVPVVRVERESARIGGAGNVARNLAALGARVDVMGVVGDDEAGADLRRMMREEGIGVEGVAVDPSRPTTRKTRVIAHHQQVVRMDHEREEPLDPDLLETLAGRVGAGLDGCDAVVVEDYDKGVVGFPVMDALREEASRSGVAWYVDPKGRDPSLYRGARCLTPNRAELGWMTGRRVSSGEEVDAAAGELLASAGSESVLLTLGDEGMVLYEAGVGRQEVPALAREVFDVTGAGDTVVAVVALVGPAGGSLLEAARLASCAAAVVVERLGTVAPTAEEIVGAARRMQT